MLLINKIPKHNFHSRAYTALKDTHLQQALNKTKHNFINKRKKAISHIPAFDSLRDEAVNIKNHTLDHLGLYLELYEENVIKSGGHVHWAQDSQEACNIIHNICRQYNAKNITKGKSIVSEEIELNNFLDDKGYNVTETDLGEYIIQLRKEKPSHIIAPAVHLTQEQIKQAFRFHHHNNSEAPVYNTASDLLSEARKVLRQKFLHADVGITGANFLIAQTGSSVIVTNEGNGDLTQILPKTHIVIASIEKIVPTIADVSLLLRILAPSATGQETSVYTTFSTGVKKPTDLEGPSNYHVVLLDNGRSHLLDHPDKEVLRCIRCGACMNHCPVYHAIGGHAYNSTYPGPIGAALSPHLFGLKNMYQLPFASSFCGRCEEVCPVRIPLPKIMRHARQKAYASNLLSFKENFLLSLWGYIVKYHFLYRITSYVSIKCLRLISRQKGYVQWLPFFGTYFSHKYLVAPTQDSFITQYKRQQKNI